MRLNLVWITINFLIYNCRPRTFKRSVLGDGNLEMSSYSVMAGRVWDLYVTYSILTGWWLSRINTYNSSLLYAWIVFLCDVIYIIDAVARVSKTTSSPGSWTSSLFSFIVNICGSWTMVTSVISALKFVTFVPYHVLVILELDITGFYLVICSLRFVRLLQSGRIYSHVIWTISTLLKTKGFVAGKKSHSPEKASREHSFKATKEGFPFLEYIRKIEASETGRRKTFKTQEGGHQRLEDERKRLVL